MIADDRAVWEEMRASRCRLAQVPAIPEPGIYALFLSEGILADAVTGSDGLLYIGMTDSSLEARNHLAHRSSGFSTVRRTIGALLKDELGLQAIPRSKGSKPNIYKFAPEGEQRLSDWMAAHLDYSFAAVERHRHNLERQLIADHKPPLNLKGWRNPQAPSIKARRKVCCLEAARSVRGK